MSEQPEKICVKCGKDVRALERSKDRMGRYWCMDCYRQAVARQQVREAERAAIVAPDDHSDLMASLIDEGVADVAPPAACPHCSAPLAPGSVLCLSCGYNAQTGEVLKTTARNRSKADKALEKAGKTVELPMLLLLSIVSGSIGGAIGAGIWAAVAYHLNLEIGWLAWGVGLLVGGGVAIGARGNTGALTGSIAVIIAIISILGAKLGVSVIVVDDYLGGYTISDAFTLSDGPSLMATDVADEWESEGRQLDWPDAMDNDHAWEREEFPADVWAEAKRRWNDLSPDERQAYIDSQSTFTDEDAIASIATDIADSRESGGERLNWPAGMDNTTAWAEDEFPADVWAEAERQWDARSIDAKQAFIDAEQRRADAVFNQAIQTAATGEVFLSTFGLLDILFFILAIGTAFTVGAGGDVNA